MIIRSVISNWQSLPFPILDVRSPSEFAQGHIPGAHSFPLFTDEERALVGTLYKQHGRDEAVLKGLEIAGPKLAGFVEKARSIVPNGKLRLLCWRGGERSASMAWLLDKAGFHEIQVLDGGYKAYRRSVLQEFGIPLLLHVIGGLTGSGKTQILEQLPFSGEQIIDLEALANHRGSAFGGIDRGAQPTHEQFENDLCAQLQGLDKSLPIWVEDESNAIGYCRIPKPFYGQMREASLVFVQRDLAQRIDLLVEEYGKCSRTELASALDRIGKKLGGQHLNAAREALEQGRLKEVARLTLRYYDKAYLRGVGERDPSHISYLNIDGLSPTAASKACIDHVRAKYHQPA